MARRTCVRLVANSVAVANATDCNLDLAYAPVCWSRGGGRALERCSMDPKMFCYQCQETAGCKGCTIRGVCGKSPEVAAMQDLLVYVTRGPVCRDERAAREGRARFARRERPRRHEHVLHHHQRELRRGGHPRVHRAHAEREGVAPRAPWRRGRTFRGRALVRRGRRLRGEGGDGRRAVVRRRGRAQPARARHVRREGPLRVHGARERPAEVRRVRGRVHAGGPGEDPGRHAGRGRPRRARPRARQAWRSWTPRTPARTAARR